MLPSRLSDILNGKKGMSRSTAVAVAEALDLTAVELRIFCDQVESLHGRSRAARASARTRLLSEGRQGAPERILTLDAFAVVSEWHHFGILQLMKLPHFKEDPKWIGDVLGIGTTLAVEALERLKRLELVHIAEGRLVPSDDYVSSPDGVPSAAVKTFHEQVIKKAIGALYSQPLDDRVFMTSLLPIAAKDLSEIRAQIKKFNYELCDRFSYSPGIDRVYGLSVQLFDLAPSLKEIRA